MAIAAGGAEVPPIDVVASVPQPGIGSGEPLTGAVCPLRTETTGWGTTAPLVRSCALHESGKAKTRSRAAAVMVFRGPLFNLGYLSVAASVSISNRTPDVW